MLYYCCPDVRIQSSGIRTLYKHVEILGRHGIEAAILHVNAGFQMPDMPAVPVRYVTTPGTVRRGDIVVLPETFPPIINLFPDPSLRLIAIALNWQYIYKALGDFFDWRRFRIERVLVNSPFIGEFIEWTMRLPWHHVPMGINHLLYFDHPAGKVAQVAYIKRKGFFADELKRVLHSRNPDFIEKIAWRALEGLAEVDYAREIRQSRVFLNMSLAEGLPFSLLEAMRAGVLVAGYNSVGGQRELVGAGDGQNCVLAENLDYVTLARKLEPVLLDVLKGDMTAWAPVLRNGAALSHRYTLEVEEQAVQAAWKEILGR